MVLAGQFLERSVVVRSGELSLDGLFHRGSRTPPAVIAPPLPSSGGSMTLPAINELAWALTRAGHATLRFDYRGVGASQGASQWRGPEGRDRLRLAPRDLEDERQDLLAAVDHLEACQEQAPVCAIGFSSGALVALAVAADPRIERLVLIAPPTSLGDLSALALVRKPLLVVCAQHDPSVDRAALRKLLEPLGALAVLEVVAHADPAFLRGIVELGRTVTRWLDAGRAATSPIAANPEPPEEAFVELELPEGDGAALEVDWDAS